MPLAVSPPGVTEVTFAEFNQPSFELRPPLDQQTLALEVPYRWIITGDDSFVEVHYDMQQDGGGGPQVGVDATVNVYFDDTLVTAFTPVEGINQSLRIPIPAEAIADANLNRHKLSFVYFSGSCDEHLQRSLFVIHDDSFIHFDYDRLPLEVNLADFPRPLAQNIFEPDSILIVIPDNYSDADLEAAASVAATMGQRTFGNTALHVVTASEATPEQLATQSAIIIGQPDKNGFILDLYQRNRLPTTLSPGEPKIIDPSDQPLSPDDGVLQEMLSEYSDNHVYLIVTGGSDIAVNRAARALSVLAPRYGFDGNLVVIADFQEIMSTKNQAKDTFSLTEFDFSDTVFYGIDTHDVSFTFFVPPNWRLIDNPTLTLSYMHSGALQATGSGLTVNLNNKPIGSAPIDQGNLGERQASIELPAADIKVGARNHVKFETITNLDLLDCVLPDLDLAWIRISENSQLQLPHVEEANVEIEASLEDPLSLFISRQDLSDVWFSLSESPTSDELNGMITVAAWLGNLTSGPGFAPRVSRGTIEDATQLEPYHLIAFGLPTTNPIIEMLNEQLPQPFVSGENNLRQEVGNVVFRLPDNFSLGLLQTLSAPWNPGHRVVLVASGTSAEGLDWAINTLTTEDSYYELKGDVAFITAERLETFDSSNYIRGPFTASTDAITENQAEVTAEVAPAEATPTAVPTPEVANLEAASERYLPHDTSGTMMVSQITFGLIGAGLVIVAVGGFLSWRKGKTQ